ncbi:MAG: nucleotide exchange factor GrpE [Thermoanaerobaculia bacterium]|nr:nucleotide exchange factor GrpE [Thermoanaerobaculia bacterium]
MTESVETSNCPNGAEEEPKEVATAAGSPAQAPPIPSRFVKDCDGPPPDEPPRLETGPPAVTVNSEEPPDAANPAPDAPAIEPRDAKEPPAAADPSDTSSASDALEGVLRSLDERLSALASSFDTKLAIDEHKNRQIDALHRDLQEHKQDLLARALRPILAGLVRLYDDLGRAADGVQERAEDLIPSEAAQFLREFREDVEILLDENGVLVFSEPVERFDPQRQTARKTLDTDDPERVGQIARRVRPGFERDGLVLQKERVDVYAARPITATATSDESTA